MATAVGAEVTPYSTAIPFITNALPAWVSSAYESQRLGSYDLYDDMFDNVNGQFKVLLRGTDDTPILVPTPRRLVQTMCRYVGRDWGFSVRPGADDEGNATPDEALALAITTIGDLFNREEILQKFQMGKPEWLRRGDWLWYLSADPLKSAGTRISIQTIDPRTYFPIIESDVVPGGSFDRVVGQMIVETVVGEDKKTFFIKRQTWIKSTHPDHPNYGQPAPEEGFDIYYESVRMDLAGWDDPEKQRVVQTYTPFEAIPGITQLPIYHIKDNPQTGVPYGRSNFAGFETIFAGINQAVSDEDLALAMAGLGMWWTDAGAPLDENNEPTNWIIGPQRVAEVPQGSKFGRLSGITSVEPQQTHIKYLEEQAYGSLGINDIALGKATVQESGVALAIRMQPLFDAANDKDDLVNSKLNQMLHDLKQWLRVYESIDLGEIEIVSESNGERLPFDRDAFYAELERGYLNKWFSLEYVWRMLNEKLGYEIDIAALKRELNAAAKKAAALADPVGDRAQKEIDANADDDEEDDPDAKDDDSKEA